MSKFDFYNTLNDFETLPEIPQDDKPIQKLIDKLVVKYLDINLGYINAAYKNDPALKKMDRHSDLKRIKNSLKGYKGTAALAAHELANNYWCKTTDTYREGRLSDAEKAYMRDSADRLYKAALKRTSIDIHPGAKIAADLFIDHGTGVVIGETAEIGMGTIMFHDVTLGNYLKPNETNPELLAHRHPRVGENCILCTGAKILGNIQIGKNVTICPSAILRGNKITVQDGVKIGSSAQIEDGNTIAAGVEIGNGAIITKNAGLINENIPAHSIVRKENGKLLITELGEGKSFVAEHLRSNNLSHSNSNGRKPKDSMDFAQL